MHYATESHKIRHHYAITLGMFISGVIALSDPAMQAYSIHIGMGINIFWLWVDA